MKKTAVVMDKEAISRSLMRMSHEIIEKNIELSNVVLVGILTRGAVLAKKIRENIVKVLNIEIPLGILDITLHRDDLDTKVRTEMKITEIPVDITGKNIILVDDVLFSGRSVRAALDELMDFGRPMRIQLAVLVDRGHRELPIRADYVGKNIPTSLSQAIEVHTKETDGIDEVVVMDL